MLSRKFFVIFHVREVTNTDYDKEETTKYRRSISLPGFYDSLEACFLSIEQWDQISEHYLQSDVQLRQRLLSQSIFSPWLHFFVRWLLLHIVRRSKTSDVSQIDQITCILWN